jgi:hypothetical protein
MIWTLAYKMRDKVKLLCACVFARTRPWSFVPNAHEMPYRYRDISKFPWHDNAIRDKVEWFNPLTTRAHISATLSHPLWRFERWLRKWRSRSNCYTPLCSPERPQRRLCRQCTWSSLPQPSYKPVSITSQCNLLSVTNGKPSAMRTCISAFEALRYDDLNFGSENDGRGQTAMCHCVRPSKPNTPVPTMLVKFLTATEF